MFSYRTGRVYAAQEGHEAALAQLLAFRADVDLRASDGQTPLHVAALWCHRGAVQQLLAAAEVDALRGELSAPEAVRMHSVGVDA